MSSGPESGYKPTEAELGLNQPDTAPELQREAERRPDWVLAASCWTFVKGQHFMRVLTEPLVKHNLDPALRLLVNLGVYAGGPELQAVAGPTADNLNKLGDIFGVPALKALPDAPSWLTLGAEAAAEAPTDGSIATDGLAPRTEIETLAQIGLDMKRIGAVLWGALERTLAEVQDFELDASDLSAALAAFGAEPPQLQLAYA